MRLTCEARGRLSEACGVLPGHCEGITHVTSKGDGVYLLTNGKDQTAKLWDIRKMVPPSIREATAHGMSGTFDYRFMPYPVRDALQSCCASDCFSSTCVLLLG
jgi:DDB1- and CUL4-associated factor 11